MRKIYTKIGIALILSGSSFASMAQISNVGIGTKSPDASAVLDIQSSEKGLLIPRMTKDARDNISNPAEGLIVYQTNDNSGFYYFSQSAWKPLTGTEANSVATLDVNGWALDGNAAATANKAAATAASFVGVPAGIPMNFKIGTFPAGLIETSNQGRNTTFGFAALNAKTASTTFNIALGYSALRNLNSGSQNFAIGASALESITSGSGNLALGTAALLSNLNGSRNTAIGNNAGFYTTGSDNVLIGNSAGFNETGSNKLYIANTNTATPLIYGDFSAKYVTIGDVPVAKRSAAGGGYNLLVKGGILTEKVKVALSSSADWADYVFEPSYTLMPLEQVESYTIVNKHLPNVPSADEMAAGGLDVSETSKIFMEKIEELTLYLIDLNKEVKALKVENELLKSKIK